MINYINAIHIQKHVKADTNPNVVINLKFFHNLNKKHKIFYYFFLLYKICLGHYLYEGKLCSKCVKSLLNNETI